MKLGAFSVSLSVKDLNASKTFYENLGFKVFAGDINMNYVIMKNENALIGLFQGMFENNILTFNPGWDENAKNVSNFDDIRKIQQQLTEVVKRRKGTGKGCRGHQVDRDQQKGQSVNAVFNYFSYHGQCVAIAIIFSSVASADSSSPAIAPCLITRIRSHNVSSSGSSLETTRTPVPCAASERMIS